MYSIKIKSQFSSAHNLRGYKGKCEALHGHNWRVEITICADELDKLGMVIDFSKLKDMLNKVIGDLDHKYLNELAPFKDINPTSENIARYVYEKLGTATIFSKRRMKGKMVAVPNLKEVTVWETDTALATYYKSGKWKMENG